MNDCSSIVQGRESSLNIQDLFLQNHWPDKDKKIEWTIIYETLISKQKLSNSLKYSNSVLNILHRKLKQFFNTGDEKYIIDSPRYLYLICQNLDNPGMGSPTLLDSKYSDKLEKLLSCISNHPEFYEEIFISILEIWLRAKEENELIKSFISLMANNLSNHNNALIDNITKHIDLYLEKEIAKNFILRNTTNNIFISELLELGIEEKYTKYPFIYFNQFFFEWIITRKVYCPELFETYINEIQLFTLDQQKIFSAKYLEYLSKNDDKNSIQEYLDRMRMYSATKRDYWMLSNSYYIETYNSLMEKAYEIVRPMITVNFISYIYNYLGIQPEFDARRLRFWIAYSKSITSIRYFFGKIEFDRLNNKLMEMDTEKAIEYSELLKENWIVNTDKSTVDNTAIIFSFGNLYVIEFLGMGKPIQIFQPDNPKIKLLFNGEIKSSSAKDIHIYNDRDEKDMYKYNPDAEEGTFSHRGDWEKDMESLLGNYKIYKDTNTIGKRPAPFYRDINKGKQLKKLYEFEQNIDKYFTAIKNEINFFKTKMGDRDISDENTKTILLNICKENIPEESLAYDLFRRLVKDECLKHVYSKDDIQVVTANLKSILHDLSINGDYLGRLSRMVFYR